MPSGPAGEYTLGTLIREEDMGTTERIEAFSNELADLVGRVTPYVVRLETGSGLWRTGIVLQDGYILTVAAQAEDGERVAAARADGTVIETTVAGWDSRSGLTLLKPAEPAEGQALPVREGAVRVGELAVTVAFPSPEGVEAALGMVRCVSRALASGSAAAEAARGESRYLQTDTGSFTGFAGSPVLDAAGRLLGITALGERTDSDYVIPAADALGTAATLKSGGSIKRGYLGIRTVPAEVPTSLTGADAAGQETGLLVVGLERDSPAAAAGFMIGDLLVSLGGKPVRDHRDLFETLETAAPGNRIEARIVRAGKLETIGVTPGERSEPHRRHRHGGYGWRCR
jgi:S1-C subfamily serine protease